MSDAPADAPRRDALDLGAAFGAALGEDLAGLVGCEVSVAAPALSAASSEDVLASLPPVTHARCRRRDGAELVPHLLLPMPDAVTLAGLLMGHSKERIEELKTEEVSPETLDALCEVMNLTSAVLSRALGEAAGLTTGLQQGDTTPRPAPASEAGWLPDGRLRRFRYAISLPDRAPLSLELLIPDELAQQWLSFPEAAGSEASVTAAAGGSAGAARPSAAAGESVAAPGAAGGELGAASEAGGAAAASSLDDAPPGAVVFVDATPPDTDESQALEAALARSVHFLDPGALNADSMDDLAQAAAIVIAFDLGGRSGLDLLEALQRDERTRAVPMALASLSPTRGAILASLRAGAKSFLCQPYEAAEIQRRLLVRGTRNAGAAAAIAAAPAATAAA